MDDFTTKKRSRNITEYVSDEESTRHKKSRYEIDRCRKLQCSTILKLLTHRYGWAFSSPQYPRSIGSSNSKQSQPMSLNTIMLKLDKGLYKGVDEFAKDIYEILSVATTYYHPNHEIHRTANKFKVDFEIKWNSLQQKWGSEKGIKEKRKNNEKREMNMKEKIET